MSHLTDEQWAEVERAGRLRFRGKGSDEQALQSHWAAELLRLREIEEENERLRDLLDDYREGADAGDKQLSHFMEENERLRAEVAGQEQDLATQEQELRELRIRLDSAHANRAMTVARLGGMVEGRLTGSHNFLQRIDELREIERDRDALKAEVAERDKDIAMQREEIERLHADPTGREDLEAEVAELRHWCAIDGKGLGALKKDAKLGANFRKLKYAQIVQHEETGLYEIWLERDRRAPEFGLAELDDAVAEAVKDEMDSVSQGRGARRMTREEERKQFDLLLTAISLLQQSLKHLPRGGITRAYKLGDRVHDFLNSDDVNNLYCEEDA